MDRTPGQGQTWGRQLLEAAAATVLRPARPAFGLVAPDVRPAWLNSYQAVWAACLRPGAGPAAAAVAVTICGRGVAPDAVRLGPVTDLRPLAAANLAEFPPPPYPA